MAEERVGAKSMKNEQEMIKSAVTEDAGEPFSQPPSASGEMQQSVMTEGYSESMQSQEAGSPQDTGQTADYQGYEQQEQAGQDYSYQDQGYQAGLISPDTISEVAEQVVAEKLSPIASAIENILDQKATFEAQIQYLDERLRRIEKTIDRLQLSVLQKVGEYVTNVDDLKREVIESQKTFKSMWEQKERKSSSNSK